MERSKSYDLLESAHRFRVVPRSPPSEQRYHVDEQGQGHLNRGEGQHLTSAYVTVELQWEPQISETQYRHREQSTVGERECRIRGQCNATVGIVLLLSSLSP